MKKLIVLMIMVFMLCGCTNQSESTAATDNGGTEILKDEGNKDNVLFERSIELKDETVKRSLQPRPATRSYTTKGNSADLDYGEFDVFFDFIYDGIPSEANYPAVKYMEGEWKYDLWYSFKEPVEKYFDEIGFADVELDYEKEEVILTPHPRFACDGYEITPETDAEVGYEPFKGGFEGNALKLIGNYAVVYITEYFAYEGREYVIGEIWFSEELHGDFWMYRGQQ